MAQSIDLFGMAAVIPIDHVLGPNGTAETGLAAGGKIASNEQKPNRANAISDQNPKLPVRCYPGRKTTPSYSM